MTPTSRTATVDTLHDAFDELERRADGYRPVTAPSPRRRVERMTPVLVVAAIALVAVIAGTLAVIGASRVGRGAERHRLPLATAAGRTAVPASVPATVPADATDDSHTPARPLPSRPAQATGRPAAPTPAPGGHHPIPGGAFARTFAARLHQVAGGSATFTADSPAATVLVGRLTVDGVTGGFDLQSYPAGRGTPASCDDQDRVRCQVSTPPGGGSLATGTETLQTVPGGITRQVVYVRGDGIEFRMHVSNAADPKGAGAVGPRPPLTLAQMVAIVTGAGRR